MVEFDKWVAARGPGLLRLAYTLTGNPADAEDVPGGARPSAAALVPDLTGRGRRRLRAPDGRQRQHLVVAAVGAGSRRWPSCATASTRVDGPGDASTTTAACGGPARRYPRSAHGRRPALLRAAEYAEIADLTGVREGTCGPGCPWHRCPARVDGRETMSDFETRLSEGPSSMAERAPGRPTWPPGHEAGCAAGGVRRPRWWRPCWPWSRSRWAWPVVGGEAGEGGFRDGRDPTYGRRAAPVGGGTETWRDLSVDVPAGVGLRRRRLPVHPAAAASNCSGAPGQPTGRGDPGSSCASPRTDPAPTSSSLLVARCHREPRAR